MPEDAVVLNLNLVNVERLITLRICNVFYSFPRIFEKQSQRIFFPLFRAEDKTIKFDLCSEASLHKSFGVPF